MNEMLQSCKTNFLRKYFCLFFNSQTQTDISFECDRERERKNGGKCGQGEVWGCGGWGVGVW